MTPEKLTKMRTCAALLPPPGPEVAGELLDEIERLRGLVQEIDAARALNNLSEALDRVNDANVALEARATTAEQICVSLADAVGRLRERGIIGTQLPDNIVQLVEEMRDRLPDGHSDRGAEGGH